MSGFNKPSLPAVWNNPVQLNGGVTMAPTGAGVTALTVKPTTGDTATSGLIVQAQNGTQLAQQLLEALDHLANPIMGIPIAGGPATFGDNAIRGSNSVFGPFAGVICQAPGNNCYYLSLGDQSGTEHKMIFCAGAPGTVNTVTVAIGDYAINTSAAASPFISRCTVAGTPGTWATVV